MIEIAIPGLPSPLTWFNQPSNASWSQGGGLAIKAGAKTDWFVDPGGASSARNAPALLFTPRAPCLLSAYITVDHAATFDAGALALYENPEAWAKLCLELSPVGRLTVVSVVNKSVSDDCNSFSIEGKSAYLRIARLERAFAFHYSQDGVRWDLIRHFVLGEPADVEMGFLAQSPVGAGCPATFREIRYEPRLLSDIRSGE